jgi:type II secretory pathway predicted ATPase ExeA
VLSEAMEHYGLAHPFDGAGFFETEHHQKTVKQMKAAIQAGRLVALSGVVGAGKTVLAHRLQEELAHEGKVLVAKSLSVDKERVTLQTLMMALFFDLSPEEEPWIPSQGERRERELRNLIRKGKKPVALFIDEAHDLHPKTLRGLKRLGEVVKDAGARLAVVLVGHPKLRNDLRRPTMEEIGHRTTIVDFKGIAGQQRPYIDWLLAQCLAEGVAAGEVIVDEAIELLARRLGTPLQIEQYLTRALEEGWRVGERPVTAQLVETLLSPQLDELEPRLRRHGYDIPDLAELTNTRQGEIRSLLRGELEPARGREITAKLMAAGLPI